MGGFIAQTLALQRPSRIDKIVLLSTDPGGTDADLAPSDVWSQLIDTSGTPHEQAQRLLSLLFPRAVAESIYREFGDVVAAARARLSADLVNRQVTAMEGWRRTGVASRLREINRPVLVATGTADRVIPPSNALSWLMQFPAPGSLNSTGVGTLSWHSTPCAGRPHQQLSQTRVKTSGRFARSLARPSSPAFSNRLRVAVYVDFFQSFDAIFHGVGRFLIFFPG